MKDFPNEMTVYFFFLLENSIEIELPGATVVLLRGITNSFNKRKALKVLDPTRAVRSTQRQKMD